MRHETNDAVPISQVAIIARLQYHGGMRFNNFFAHTAEKKMQGNLKLLKSLVLVNIFLI